MQIAASSARRHGGAAPDGETARAFTVNLPLRYYTQTSGACGVGVTRHASRKTVAFQPSGAVVKVGDALLYVLMFPRRPAARRPVAICRGRVVRVDVDGVIVTIDEYSFRAASAVGTPRVEAQKNWLSELFDGPVHAPVEGAYAGCRVSHDQTV